MGRIDFKVVQDLLAQIDLYELLLGIEYVLAGGFVLLLLVVIYAWIQAGTQEDNAESLNRYLQDWKDIGIKV